MIRIGIVSDTHLNSAQELPKALIQGLKGLDLILHAGDLVRLEVLSGLKELAPEVKAVYGNMDSPEVKTALPEKEIISAGQFRIGLTHGLGAPVNLVKTVQDIFKEEKLDCIVFGHSHSPYNQLHQGIVFFNPGSPTDKFFAPYNSFGIMEIDKVISGKIIKL